VFSAEYNVNSWFPRTKHQLVTAFTAKFFLIPITSGLSRITPGSVTVRYERSTSSIPSLFNVLLQGAFETPQMLHIDSNWLEPSLFPLVEFLFEARQTNLATALLELLHRFETQFVNRTKTIDKALSYGRP